MHNQQGNIICLELLTCYDTTSLLLTASWVRFLSCCGVGSSVLTLQSGMYCYTYIMKC